MSSGASSGSWSKPPSGRSSRLSSCPTAASVSRRTRAAAVPISGFVSDGRNWSRPLSSGGQEQKVLIGLTSFITKNPPMLPKLNRRRAQFVLTKINEILAWEQRKEVEKDMRFVELGRYLCEVRAGQYWRLENLKSFDEFLERRSPESRRKAYCLMSIHEHLPPQVKRELKQVGWTKGLELAKLARSRDGQEFDCATWLHKARVLSKDEFRREVEKELTGKETEPWEIIYFKLYKSQVPVIEQALETAALMLGSDRSRGYCLEMICADFLAGANLDSGDPDVLLRALSNFFKFLPGEQRQAFAQFVTEKIQVNRTTQKQAPTRLERQDYKELREQVLRRDGWRCQLCGSMRNLEVHHREFRSRSGADDERNLITLCSDCHSPIHGKSMRLT